MPRPNYFEPPTSWVRFNESDWFSEESAHLQAVIKVRSGTRELEHDDAGENGSASQLTIISEERSGYVIDEFLTSIAKGAGVKDIAKWNEVCEDSKTTKAAVWKLSARRSRSANSKKRSRARAPRRAWGQFSPPAASAQSPCRRGARVCPRWADESTGWFHSRFARRR